MLRRLEDLARSDLASIGAGVLLALAAFELIRAFVDNLVMPAIFALFGESEFPYLSFAIGSAEFPFGFVLSAAITFAICLLAIPLLKADRRHDGPSETRSCPECLTPIPNAAKRCPECTAVVTPAVT